MASNKDKELWNLYEKKVEKQIHNAGFKQHIVAGIPVKKIDDNPFAEWNKYADGEDFAADDLAYAELDKALNDKHIEADELTDSYFDKLQVELNALNLEHAIDLNQPGPYKFKEPMYVGAYPVNPAMAWADKKEPVDKQPWAKKLDGYLLDGDGFMTKGRSKKIEGWEDNLEPKPKRPRFPAYKKNDRVTTPNGPGNVWSVDRDGTVCVELDSDPTILHEFEKKELKKLK